MESFDITMRAYWRQNKYQKQRKDRYPMITGATGFLGSHLLSEILRQPATETVYCLVRTRGEESPMDRLRTALQSRGLWREEHEHRIVALASDVQLHHFGLDDGTTNTFLRLSM